MLEYKGLKATRETLSVTEEQIDTMMIANPAKLYGNE